MYRSNGDYKQAFKNIYLFILRERERERQREREIENPSRLCTVSTGPNVGLELTNCEIVT